MCRGPISVGFSCWFSFLRISSCHSSIFVPLQQRERKRKSHPNLYQVNCSQQVWGCRETRIPLYTWMHTSIRYVLKLGVCPRHTCFVAFRTKVLYLPNDGANNSFYIKYKRLNFEMFIQGVMSILFLYWVTPNRFSFSLTDYTFVKSQLLNQTFKQLPYVCEGRKANSQPQSPRSGKWRD